MNVVEKIRSVRKRSKEIVQTIARKIAEENDYESIRSLVALMDDPDRNTQSLSIEVLYEVGYLKPYLLTAKADVFADLLESNNNRLVWGAMIALSSISSVAPQVIFDELPKIVDAENKGSVITRDAGVVIYANLSTLEKQRAEVFPLLMRELAGCSSKQLPQYAEKSLIAIDDMNRKDFVDLIQARLPDLEKESQVKRIKKVLRDVES